MPFDVFLLSDLQQGIDESKDPWLIDPKQYTSAEDVYFKRGIVTKRNGRTVLGQLGLLQQPANLVLGAANYTGSFANVPIIPFSVYFISGLLIVTDDGNGNLIGNVDPLGTNTINYATGAYNVTFSAITIANVVHNTTYERPVAQQVRGLKAYKRNGVSDELIAWDTGRVYKYNTTRSATNPYFQELTVADTFNSTRPIWATSFFDLLFMSDHDELTGKIQTYDGSTGTVAYFTPLVNATDSLYSCLIMVEYHDVLVCLNTKEMTAGGIVHHPERARWHRRPNPLAANAWREDMLGQGGYNDAPTDEFIVGAGFVKDTLIVQFTKGYWALVYTGNPVTKFVWKQITPRGSTKSTFGTVVFESAVMGLGLEGILACNGNEVVNIDTKIPDFIYEIDLDNFYRCYSKTIDRLEQTWIAYPSASNTSYNDKILIMNQGEEAYSIYNLTANCIEIWQSPQDKTFGYFTGKTFGELVGSWASLSLQANMPITITGGDNGYIYQTNAGGERLDAVTWDSDTATPIGFNVQTPRLNPYKDKGKKACLHWVKLFFERMPQGKLTVDFFYDNFDGAALTREIDLTQGYGNKSWFTICANQTANFHMFRIYLSEKQLADSTCYLNKINYHGAQLAFSPAGDFDL